jgi:hypothetical protein
MEMIDRRIFLAISFAVAAPPATATDYEAEGDDGIVRRLRAEGIMLERRRMVLWIDPGEKGLADSLADRLADGVGVVERRVGVRFDTSHYGQDRIEYFVARDIRRSHVLGGYEHPKHRQPYVFLPLRMVRAGIDPYLHETTHIILWKYGSHTLREGLADFVHSSEPRFGGGINRIADGVFDRSSAERVAAETLRTPIGGQLLAAMGANGIPGNDLALGPSRREYYVAAYAFVAFLLDAVPMERFVELYTQDDVEAAAMALTGRDMAAWRTAWLGHLGLHADEIR